MKFILDVNAYFLALRALIMPITAPLPLIILSRIGRAAEQRGRQQRQRAVFGGRRADAPMQRMLAGNGDHLHERASPEEI